VSEQDEGWSRPALYAGGERVITPRTFTEADPISSVLVADWGEAEAADQVRWSTPTYVGRRRLRPGTRPAAEAIDQARRDGALALEQSAPAGPAAPEAAPATPGSEDAGRRGLLENSRTMAIASLVSRVTGFLRSSLLVAAIGIGHVGDAYNLANNFPNMVYELLLGGVLSSVLVPLLVHAQEDDADGGIAYTQRLLSIATAALGAMTLVAVACAPLIAAGFVPYADQRSLTSVFATLLLPEIFFYGVGAMFMAVLNVRHSYGPGAWAPVVNNVVMIVTLGVFFALPGPDTLDPTSITTAQILVLGIGTTLGIAAQALVLVPALRTTGFRWKWRFRARPNELGRMREVGRLAGWVLGYVVASQIGVTVIAVVGGRRHVFTVFTNADLLVQMPYGILVVSLLTALMPRLSRAAARGRTADVVADLGLGGRLSAVALLPITAGLIVLGPPLCVTLFAYGETTIAGARLIGTALAASAFGLFPFAIVMLQLRIFYAMRDGRTPTMINAFMVATKVVLVLVCAATIDDPAHMAEALTVATSASYLVGAVAGHVLLSRRLGHLGFASVANTAVRIGSASVIGGAAAWAVVLGCEHGLGRGHVGSLAALLAGAIVGLAVLGVVASRLRLPELQDIRAMVRR
jgi:putative peptidoglycan lipid II flippase